MRVGTKFERFLFAIFSAGAVFVAPIPVAGGAPHARLRMQFSRRFTERMTMQFAESGAASVPVHLIASDRLEPWLETQPEALRLRIRATPFAAALGEVELLRGEDGAPQMGLAGYGTEATRRRGRFHLAGVAEALPEGTYRLESELEGRELEEAALGWLLSGYRFDRYKSRPPQGARLCVPPGIDGERLELLASAEKLTRDLVNTPANDMGPADLQHAVETLGNEYGAKVDTLCGGELLERGFPMIHTVGRAAVQEPRLIDLRWGGEGPRLTLVGKGVCFDTGGLNLKPGASMGLMKKDMGGAANVLGLARMIMGLGLPLRLRVLIPAVENAVSAAAFRPGDVLTSRKGLTVEVNNTDAEGRLVLADALAYADEETPDLLISMATLTGAARVAVGPDLAPFYATGDVLARALREAAPGAADPVWEMPFWEPYESMIEPGIADLDNAPSGGFAGSITAALFLRRFVEKAPNYAHFDIYAWRPAGQPGLPKGGVAQGPRAILAALPEVLKL